MFETTPTFHDHIWSHAELLTYDDAGTSQSQLLPRILL